MKLGSLFDGSGGFPLAGALCDIEPVWAAEVEPYPIAVTRSRFPNMKHLGDISKINGGEIEPVDIITFGSPCQDLSVAGKRAGLKHEANGDEETTRSGLFMEAVRIIKEMRKATNGRYPTFALWENVPGAFSSNKGEDFRIVCEELIKIVEPSAVMPAVPKNGWSYADSYIGDGWSLAYRVFDAQYWGVPQRRRRIHLVADFSGKRAREILFEREGVRGYFTQGGTSWQATAIDAQDCTGADDREGESNGGNRGRQLDELILDDQGGQQITVRTDGKAPTLRTETHGNLPCVVEPIAFAANQRDEVRSLGDKSGAIQAQPGMKQQTFIAVPYTLKIRSDCEGGGKGALIQKDKSATLATNNDQYLFQPVVYSVENHPADSRVNIDDSGKVQTLTSRMGTGGGNVSMLMEPTDKFVFENHGQDTRYKGPLEICPIVSATFGMGGNNQPFVVESSPVVFDGANVTSPINASNPQPGDPCHTLSTDSRNYAVICLQGNGIDRADTAGCNGKGWNDESCYTLNTIDRPAVAYSFYPQMKAESQCFVEGVANTIVNGTNPGYQNGVIVKEPPHYIVRRLTPTECARLQGFADWWGHIEQKDSLTDKEYRFWLEVRNTHAAINGKKVQDYTEQQMLTWYNKLWTDAAEYKMWGNGIALPPALYCLQGIVEAERKYNEQNSNNLPARP